MEAVEPEGAASILPHRNECRRRLFPSPAAAPRQELRVPIGQARTRSLRLHTPTPLSDVSWASWITR